MEYSAKHTMMLGPWGGDDGFYWDDGVYSAIRQLEIAHGAGIDSIKIEYDIKGKPVWSDKHGGLGGSKFDKVRLEYPHEYLTSLHGHYCSLQGHGVHALVRSLTFETNKRIYGPFGVEEGTSFSSKMHGKILGFVGKCGWNLNSIGVYIEPLQKPMIPTSPIVTNSMYLPHHNEFTQSPDNCEYSMIQGSLGKNFDLIVAVRQRDEAKKSTQSAVVNQYTSRDEPKITEVANARIVPSIIEKVPSRIIEKAPSKTVKGVVKSVTWGGHGGSSFDDGVYDGVMQINVYRNVAISSIRVCYDSNGEPVWGSKHGGIGSIWYDKIVIDYPSEKLSHVSGYHGPTMIMGPNAIKSLTFHTTKDKYGPYGDEEGEFFTTKTNGGSVVLGFHGRTGLFLDSIGVHTLETNAAVPSSSNMDTSLSSTTPPPSKITFKIGKEVKSPSPVGPYETGPWGGEGGKAWDDGVFSGVKQIIVTKTSEAICCVEIEYDRSGQSVWSVRHGGGGGQAANQVKLEYPNELLTCISGYYGPMIGKEHGTNVILSLTFHTSRRKWGPFGEEVGTYFSSGTTEGKVVGFHGRSSSYLDAIGVHMPHWLGNNRKGNKGSSSSIMKRIFY